MFKHIFVPLDGSAMAEAALPAAAYFAKCFDAQVSLVHLIEKGRPRTVHDQPHLHLEKEAAAYLARIAASFPRGSRVDFHVHAEEVSQVAQSIVDHTMAELHSDLVIMCTHGGDGTRRFVSGSIAQQVIARGTIPVLVVHADQKPQGEFACGKILVPIGGQGDHGNIFDSIKQFARCCGAVIRMVSIVPTFDTIPGKWSQVGRLLPGTTSEMLDIEREEMEHFLKLQAAHLSEKGFVSEINVLRGDPGHMISVDAEDSDVSMILMATHGKAGMSAFWEGSVASKVFAESRRPIMLLPVVQKTQ